MTSVVSVPPAGDGAWRFDRDVERFAVRVTLEGRGDVTVALRLLSDGDTVTDRTERIALDGRRVLTFPGLELPAEGRYRLTLEVTGPGIRQSSDISVTRG